MGCGDMGAWGVGTWGVGTWVHGVWGHGCMGCGDMGACNFSLNTHTRHQQLIVKRDVDCLQTSPHGNDFSTCTHTMGAPTVKNLHLTAVHVTCTYLSIFMLCTNCALHYELKCVCSTTVYPCYVHTPLAKL